MDRLLYFYSMLAHIQQHPPALKTCFSTEMWERYGFYVVQSLLALYLALHFHWSDNAVYSLVSAFTGLTYLSPVLGGWIADNWLGQKKSILLGAAFLFASYLALTFMQTDTFLKLALAGIAVGTGLLKPNISSILGHAYPDQAPERESGFTIFYMGITTGIILGTTLPSYLQHHFGWSVTFGSAAIGILLAAYVFYFGVIRYKIMDCQDNISFSLKETLAYPVSWLAFLWILCLLVLWDARIGTIVFIGVLLLSAYFVLHAASRESKQQARQTHAIGLLCLISVIYWAFYFQMFLSLTLFITRIVQPKVYGLDFPAPYYVCIESIGMLLFGYFISKHKSHYTKQETAIRVSTKFFISVISIALAYMCIIFSIWITPGISLISPFLIIPAYLLISISELLLSPVGLSMITVLADRKRVSTLMGVFFVSLSLGGYLSGLLAKITNLDSSLTDVIAIKSHYMHAFSVLFMILLASIIVSYFIKRMIVCIIKSGCETSKM